MAVRSSSGSRKDAISMNRWIVHVALIVGFLTAVVSAIELSKKYLGHSGVTDHSIIGLVVFALVVVHLIQRRHTLGRLIARFAGHRGSPVTRKRLAVSDMILWLLALNATISGFADFVIGHTIYLSIPGPAFFQKWHEMSALVLIVYVITHVIRRRSRLRTSRIR
jgi:hypothetical protein